MDRNWLEKDTGKKDGPPPKTGDLLLIHWEHSWGKVGQSFQIELVPFHSLQHAETWVYIQRF